MNKSAILSLKFADDKGLTPQQRELRQDRILNVTHEIYKRFQIEVMVPKLDYIVKNSGKGSAMTTKKIGDAIGTDPAESGAADQPRSVPALGKMSRFAFGLHLPIR